jgi:hypothetical protein
MSSETTKEIRQYHVDPIIMWPSVTALPLRDWIGEMQRLNPQIHLRCATSTWEPDKTKLHPMTAAQMCKDIAESPPQEYLIYDGTSLDVVQIRMPYIPSDQAMSGLGDLNKEGFSPVTDIGNFEGGPRRIERLPDGGLLIRPRSRAVDEAAGAFSWAYQKRFEGKQQIDQMLRFQRSWGIFRDPCELWEVEFAYFMPGYLYRTNVDEEYWRTIPIGTISYIDRYDLAIEDHYARAQAIVAAGSSFAIVGDVEKQTLRIFRKDSVTHHVEAVRIPEWPWFDIPVKAT